MNIEQPEDMGQDIVAIPLSARPDSVTLRLPVDQQVRDSAFLDYRVEWLPEGTPMPPGMLWRPGPPGWILRFTLIGQPAESSAATVLRLG